MLDVDTPCFLLAAGVGDFDFRRPGGKTIVADNQFSAFVVACYRFNRLIERPGLVEPGAEVPIQVLPTDLVERPEQVGRVGVLVRPRRRILAEGCREGLVAEPTEAMAPRSPTSSSPAGCGERTRAGLAFPA